MCIIRTSCSYVKFRSFTTIEREGALGPLIPPFFGTPMANVCNICLCFTDHVRGRRKIGGSPKTEARGESGSLVAVKTQSRARGFRVLPAASVKCI